MSDASSTNTNRRWTVTDIDTGTTRTGLNDSAANLHAFIIGLKGHTARVTAPNGTTYEWIRHGWKQHADTEDGD